MNRTSIRRGSTHALLDVIRITPSAAEPAGWKTGNGSRWRSSALHALGVPFGFAGTAEATAVAAATDARTRRVQRNIDT